MTSVTIGPIPIEVPGVGTVTIPKGSYPLTPPAGPVPPVQSSVLFATSFDPPCALGPLVGGMVPINGLSALPWRAQQLAIQCLGPPSEHRPSIVATPSVSGGHALRTAMLAGSGSDQEAVLIAPVDPVEEFYLGVDVMLDANLATKLSPAMNWTEVFEWKTGGQGANYGGDRRFKFEVNMDGARAMHWRMILDDDANDPTIKGITTIFDSAYDSKVPVVPGVWTRIEHYCCRAPGRELIWCKVGGVEVARCTLPNYGIHHAPINRILLNLYSAAYPQERFWRNLEIRSGLP